MRISRPAGIQVELQGGLSGSSPHKNAVPSGLADLTMLTQGMELPQAYRPPVPEPFIPRVPFPDQREFRILDYVTKTGKQDSRNWKAQCPSCAKAGRDKSRNNLGIKISESWKYQCRAGCTKEDIRGALGQPIRKKVMA